MKETKGNLFDFNVIVIPTNGIVKTDCRLVMGKGLALKAKQLYTDIDLVLGSEVKYYGNQCYLITNYDKIIISFPTKHHWKEKSDLVLIEKGLTELITIADNNNLVDIYLPKLGCGNGELNYVDEVRPLLESYLDNRFIVVL